MPTICLRCRRPLPDQPTRLPAELEVRFDFAGEAAAMLREGPKDQVEHAVLEQLAGAVCPTCGRDRA